MDRRLARRARARFVVVALGLVTVGVFGYLGFRVVASGGVAAGSVGLGAATGFAAFFSPCSFPLLLTFLTRRSAETPRQGLLGAFRVALGVAVLLSLVAVVVVAAGDAVGKAVAFDRPVGRTLRALVGAFLIVLGAHQAHLLRLRLRIFDRVATTAARALEPTSERRWARDIGYGLGYLLAGFGCTGALLAGLAAQSLTTDTATTLWSFASAIGVFTVLIASASVAVSLATGESLRAFRMVGSSVRKWSGYVLIALGSWFVLLVALPSPLI
ncbi:MAG: cytochrome c biogenesis protein CcdA [Acidimicrobiia bacterium]